MDIYYNITEIKEINSYPHKESYVLDPVNLFAWLSTGYIKQYLTDLDEFS